MATEIFLGGCTTRFIDVPITPQGYYFICMSRALVEDAGYVGKLTTFI